MSSLQCQAFVFAADSLATGKAGSGGKGWDVAFRNRFLSSVRARCTGGAVAPVQFDRISLAWHGMRCDTRAAVCHAVGKHG